MNNKTTIFCATVKLVAKVEILSSREFCRRTQKRPIKNISVEPIVDTDFLKDYGLILKTRFIFKQTNVFFSVP